MLDRVKRLLRPVKRPRDARPVSVREFKESAWQSAEAAARYLEETDVPSLSMDVEHRVALEFGRGCVLDVAAGTGRFSRSFLDRGLRVISLDLSLEMLKAGRRSARARHGRGYDCVVASAFALPFGPASFDTVTAFWLFVHFDEWPHILVEMLRVARPGGRVVFEVQNPLNLERASEIDAGASFHSRLKTPDGYHAFATHEEVAAVAGRAGGVVEWSRYYGLFGDNFIAQAVLGGRYDSWSEEVRALLEDENCRRFWTEVEMRGLPPHLGRKEMIVVRKTGASAADAPDDPLEVACAAYERTDEVERSLALFREAFEPAGLELPLAARSA
jgi:ubiquinone/menaquinone biosynthesis C-methylase UbiE